MPDTAPETNNVELATELTIAWLSNPNTRASAGDVPGFLQSMHAAVSGLSAVQTAEPASSVDEQFTPAVTARKSLASKDHIISMIDGKPYKTLKRHLSGHGLTPDQYRERFGLRPDYPMVSEAYSQARRDMAKKIGLGRRPGQTVAKAGDRPANAQSRRKAKPANSSKS
ncbi:MucR family transcriptional regulator [Parablastomonas sp. CN1-191]|uniref:MucR family transcriptional regulator n=1 Tax=Parablastomonas sp. CN1-191 TaxID=3400908 RepID=UPI003BF9143E